MDEKLVEELLARLQSLETRVQALEGKQVSGSTRLLTTTDKTVATSSAEQVDLVAAIGQALEVLGEGEVGAIRQQIIKAGLPNSVSRSDVNKTLYNRKDLFELARQEGAKPIWKLVNSGQA